MQKQFKYGLTIDIKHRMKCFGQIYNTCHIIHIDSRLNNAKLEANLKFRFEGREYLELSEIHKFFIEFRSIRNNITNPFNLND